MPKNVEYIITLKDKFSKNLKGVNREVGNLNRTSQNVMGTLKKFAPLLAGVGVAMVFKKAIQTSIGFEKSMSDVKAITNATYQEFQQLDAQAQQLGATTVFSAKEAADGMKFLGMAGFSTKNIMSALPGVLDLAAAGSIDLARAADIASNVLTQFGIKAENLGTVNDIIAKTATSSNVSVEQMAESLKYTGTTSKILGQSLAETSAAIGLLGNAGLQGGIGGTSLNFAMLEMANQASPTAKKLRDLGVQVLDNKGKFVGITSVIKQFEDKNISATKSLEIFGKRGGRAFGALLLAGSDQLKTFTTELENSEGAAKRMAEIKLDNLAGDLTMLKSASQGLAITMGKRMTPSMRKTTQIVTKLVQGLDKLVKIPIEKKIKKESIEVSVLVGKLRNANLKEGDRLEIIEKLRSISPDLVKGIDSENVSMKKLTENLREYNKAQAKRIVLAGLEEKEQKLIADEAVRVGKIEKLLTTGQVAGGGLLGMREKALEIGNKTYAETLGKFIDAVEKGDVALAETAKSAMPVMLQDEGSRIIKQLKLINSESSKQVDIAGRIQRVEKQLGISTGIDGELNLKTKLDKEGQNLESKITSRSPKVININIEKLIETQEINTQNLTESVPQVKRLITEAVMDALNDTQQTYKAG